MTDLNQVQADKLVELTINDLLVKLPVEKIKISQDYKSQEALPLRSGSSFIVSGFGSSVRVNIPIIGQFGTESSRDIVTLYNYIRKMPFAFIKSHYLKDYMEKGLEGLLTLKTETVEKIAGESQDKLQKEASELSYEERRMRAYEVVKGRIMGKSEYMVFAVNQMNLSTIPGTSDGVRLTLDMEFSLYTPYVKDLIFRRKAFSPEQFKEYNSDWEKVHEAWHMNNLTKEDYFLHRYRTEKASQATRDLSESDVFKYLYGGGRNERGLLDQTEIDYTTGEIIDSEMPFLTAIPNSDLEFEIVDHGSGFENIVGSIKLPDTATTFVGINHAFQFSSITLQGMPYPLHQYLGLGQSTCMAGFVSRGSDDSNLLNSVINFYNIFQSMNPRVQEKVDLGEPRLVLPKIRVKNEFLNQMGITNIVFNAQVKETIQGTSDGEQFVISFIDANKSNPNSFQPRRTRFTPANYAYLNTARKLLADKLNTLKGKSVVFNFDLKNIVDPSDPAISYYGTSSGSLPVLVESKQGGFQSIDEIEDSPIGFWPFSIALDKIIGKLNSDKIDNEPIDKVFKTSRDKLVVGEAELKELFDLCLESAKAMVAEGISNATIDGFVRSFIMSTGVAFVQENGSWKVTRTANPKSIVNFMKTADKATEADSDFKTIILPNIIAIKLLETLVGKAEQDKEKTAFIVSVEDVVSLPSSAAASPLVVGNIRLDPELQKKITEAANRNGVDPNLLIAQVRQESRFKADAVSYAGAAGLVQLMPATARQAGLSVSEAAYNADAARIQHFDKTPNRDKTKDSILLDAVEKATLSSKDPSKDERFDPDKNINAAAKYLAELVKKTGSQELGLAAYNAGPGNRSVRAGRIPKNGETDVYVANIMQFKAEIDRQQTSGLYSPKYIIDTHLNKVGFDAVPYLFGILTNTEVINVVNKDEIDNLIHESKIHSGYSYGDFNSRVHPYSEKLQENSGIPDRVYMNPDEFIYSNAEIDFFTETHLADTGSPDQDPALSGTSDDTIGLPIELFEGLQQVNIKALEAYNYRRSPDITTTIMMSERKENGNTDLVTRKENNTSTSEPKRVPTVSSAGTIANPSNTHNNATSRQVANKALGNITESYPESDIDPNLKTRQGTNGEAYVRQFDPTQVKDFVTDVKESSIKNYLKDNPGFRKALPTFKIFFLEEDSYETEYRVLDDFYDTNGILEISILEEKDNPIQTALIKGTNPAQRILSMASLEEGHYALTVEQQAQVFEQNKPYQSTDETSMEERFMDYFPLKENTKIMIYLGYDQDVNKMTKKFVGFISQIDGGEILNLVAHSYGAELVIDRSTEKRDVGFNNPEPYGTTIARSILSQPNILHFGRWQINDYENYKIDSREKIRAAMDGERDLIIKVLKGSLFESFTDPKLIRRALTTWGYLRAANYDENIFIPYSETIESNISKVSLPNAHSWRILKEIEMKYPGIIVYPLPYENRMTMYVGPANGKYAFREYNMAELMYVATRNKNKIQTLNGLVNTFLANEQTNIQEEVTYNGPQQLTSTQLEEELVKPRVQLLNSENPNLKLKDGEVRSLMLVPGSIDPFAPYIGEFLDSFVPGLDWVSQQISTPGFKDVNDLKYELDELMVSYFGYITNLLELRTAQKNNSNPVNGSAIALAFVDRYAEIKNVFLTINEGDERKAKIAASIFMLTLLCLDDQFTVNTPSATDSSVRPSAQIMQEFMGGGGAATAHIDRLRAFSQKTQARQSDDSFFFFDDQIARMGLDWSSGWLTVNETAGRIYYNLNRIMNMAITGVSYKQKTESNVLLPDDVIVGAFPNYMDRLKVFNEAAQGLIHADISNSRTFAYFIKLITLLAAPQVGTSRLTTGRAEFSNNTEELKDQADAVEDFKAGADVVGALAIMGAGLGLAAGSIVFLSGVLATQAIGTAFEMLSDNNEGVDDIFGNLDGELKGYIVPWVIINEILDSDSPFDTSLASSKLIVNTRHKMFRQYHTASSAKNIIFNGIKYTEKNVFNAISVDYDSGITDIGGETKILKFDQSLPDWKLRVYPYSTSTEISSEDEAVRYASAIMEKNINRSYEGPLILLGNPEIKPYDYIYLNDTYRSMFGFTEVRAVVHTLNRQGFITEVTPGLCTSFYDTVNPSLLAGVAYNFSSLLDSEADAFEVDNDYRRSPNPQGLSDEQLKAQYEIDLKKELARTLMWQQMLAGTYFFTGISSLAVVGTGFAAKAAITTLGAGGAVVLGSFGTFFAAAVVGVTAWYGICSFFLPEDDNRIPVAVHPLVQNNQPFIGEGFNPKSITSMAAYKNQMVHRALGLGYLIEDIKDWPSEFVHDIKMGIIRSIINSR